MQAGDNLQVEVSNRQILQIALPIVFAMLVPQANLLTNNIFLGHLGEEHLGNAGITGIFYLIFAVAGHGLNIGVQTILSKYAGANDPKRFKHVLAQAFRVAIVMAVAFMAICIFGAKPILGMWADEHTSSVEASFLRIRAIGLPFLFFFQLGNAFLVASLNSRYLFWGFIFEATVNILFDYLLIFGKFGLPAMGFNGAALASVLAEFSGFVLVWSVIYKTGLLKKYRLLSDFSFDKGLLKEVINISSPLIIQFIISISTWLFFFFLIEDRGSEAKAISNTMRNVIGLCGIFIWSFASTSTTMVGNLIGQRKHEDVLKAITRISVWSLGATLIVIILLNIFPGIFFSIFGQPKSFVFAARPVLHMVSAGLIGMSLGAVWLNGITGTGKTRVNLLIELVAIVLYIGYSWYVMKSLNGSLAMGWSNEIVYWFSILALSAWFLLSGKWNDK